MYQFLVLKLKIQFVNEKYFENLLIFRLRRSYNCLVCGCLGLVDREFFFRELFKFNRGGDSGLHAGAFYGDSLIQGYTHALALINLLSV